jgi:glycosyltransferase involved in cell wall biosynthesis
MAHFQAQIAASIQKITPTVAVTSAAAAKSPVFRGVPLAGVHTGEGRLGTLLAMTSPLTWIRLLRALKAARADLIHITGVHETSPVVCLVGRMLGKPVVYTVHDPEAHPGVPLAIRIADWLTARLASALIVLTVRGRTALESKGIQSERVHLIPHPIYSVLRRRRGTKPRSEKMALYFGRLEPYKGLDVLANAFGLVRRELKGWRLMIAGGGTPPASLIDAPTTEIELLNRYLPDEEVATLMERARFVVLPYTSATQSGVIAMAYAFGRPVIASDVGGLGEMVVQGKTGVLVPPRDERALAAAMRWLAGDSRRLSRMRRNIAALSRGRWNPRRIAQAHVRVYQQVLAEAERS